MTVAHGVASSCFARQRLVSPLGGVRALVAAVPLADGGAAYSSRPRRRRPGRLPSVPRRTLSEVIIRPAIVCDASCRWSMTSAVVSSSSADEQELRRACSPAAAAVCGQAEVFRGAQPGAATIEDSV